jgi:hypothetical protein
VATKGIYFQLAENDSKRKTNFVPVLLFFALFLFFFGGGVDIYGLGCILRVPLLLKFEFVLMKKGSISDL